MLDLFATDWRSVWLGATSEPVGAIFTKPEIVELILDLAGYRTGGDRLATHPLLEPSCGDGAFLTTVVNRLVLSESEQNDSIDWTDAALDLAIRAADINMPSVLAARALVRNILMSAGASASRADRLAETWIVQTDFLLADWPTRFDFVIGNPPYVRIEDVPKRVLARYRELFHTTSDRADLYVAFFERGLDLLSAEGTLAFICANRFTKNKYGHALRRLIAQQYRVRSYVNLEHTQPFESDVSAYPAIIVVDRQRGEPTRAATLSDIEPGTVDAVRTETLADRRPRSPVAQFASWYTNGGPWLTTSHVERDALDKLDRSLPTLEQSAPATRVGIGVATGADAVFVLDHKHPDIEESRQIPLLLSADVHNEAVHWSGRYILNPFADADDGSLVDLSAYPGFADYVASRATVLKRRHCAKSNPNRWYRTIDRIWPRLQNRQKLVIPDIQGRSTIGFDAGECYPHHNLYWITSDTWPLLALKALLRSTLVYQQVRAHSVQMRGGSVRFQAQTLRKVRLPHLGDIPDTLLDQLATVAAIQDQGAIDSAANEAFAAGIHGARK